MFLLNLACMLSAQYLGSITSQGSLVNCNNLFKTCILYPDKRTALLAKATPANLYITFTLETKEKRDNAKNYEDDTLRYHLDRNYRNMTLVSATPTILVDLTDCRSYISTFLLDYGFTHSPENFSRATCTPLIHLFPASRTSEKITILSLHYPLPPPTTFRCLTHISFRERERLLTIPRDFYFYGSFTLDHVTGPGSTLEGNYVGSLLRYVFDNYSTTLLAYKATIPPPDTGFQLSLTTLTDNRNRQEQSRLRIRALFFAFVYPSRLHDYLDYSYSCNNR